MTDAFDHPGPPRAADLETPLADRFAELKPRLSLDQAHAEAARCLYCYDAPCTRACPAGIDVPGFIKKVATGNLRGAARTILSENILGLSCARVCPTEELCEGACVLRDLHGGRAVAIGSLQRHATEPFVLGAERGTPLFAPVPPRGHEVAVVGAGPAGLSCAAELARRGFDVRVFEASSTPGGLNSNGVAEYKLDRATALAEVDWVRRLGVEILCDKPVVLDAPGDAAAVRLADLVAQHAAVFVGVGLGGVAPIGIPGEQRSGCRDVLELIAELKSRTDRAGLSLAGKTVAVLGGGNTAIDGVTQSARLGAQKVYLVYRRGRSEMRAYAHEVELARLDGAELVLWARPVEVLGAGADGPVTGLRCQRTRLRDGRLEDVPGETFDLAVDLVLRATGQSKRRELLGQVEGLALDASGAVVVDEHGKTTHPKIWAGGDCVNGGKEVVNAVAEGKRAAAAIIRELEA